MECDECHEEMNEYLPCDDCGESCHAERIMTVCDKCGKTICSKCIEDHVCQEIIKK